MIGELLIKRKAKIIESWVRAIIEKYPPETAKFLTAQKNRFSNPVGYIIADSAEKIYNELISGNDINKIKQYLNEFIKIRAVQDLLPSEAVEFIYSLKNAIRIELHEEIKDNMIEEELVIIESKIDQIVLAAFDLYMEAREKVFQIHLNEIKSRLI